MTVIFVPPGQDPDGTRFLQVMHTCACGHVMTFTRSLDNIAEAPLCAESEHNLNPDAHGELCPYGKQKRGL